MLVLFLIAAAFGLASESQQQFDAASLLAQKGRLEEAAKKYQSLLPEFRAQGDSDHLARSLAALAQIATQLGDYSGAATRSREAAAVYRAAGDKHGEARALNSQAGALTYRGDYLAAQSAMGAALKLFREASDAEGQVDQLSNLGSVRLFLGRYFEALNDYQEALALVNLHPEAPWSARRRQIVQNNLAALYQRLGMDQQALDLFNTAMKGAASLRPSEQAQLMVNAGSQYRRGGDPLKALELYRAAQDLYAREKHMDGQIAAIKNTGIVYARDLSNPQAAAQAFTRALALAGNSHNERELTQARLYRGEVRLANGELPRAAEDFDAALAASSRIDAVEEKWKALYGLGRIAELGGDLTAAANRYQQAIVEIEAIRSRLQLNQLKTDFLAGKRDVYDSLIAMKLQNRDAQELFTLMERSRARTFQDRVSEREGNQAPPPVSIAAIQQKLDDSTLVLEYWVGRDRYAAVWISRDQSGIAAAFHLFDHETAAMLGLQKQILERGDWKGAARTVAAMLLDVVPPLARSRFRNVVVIPDGPIAAVPFEVLPVGGEAPLIERSAVSYAPSAALLLRNRSAPVRHWPWQRQLVAFGDPLLNASAKSGLSGEQTRLPFSAVEVRSIARMSRGSSLEYLAAEDRKSRSSDFASAPILHLATHAVADPVYAERSRILFTPERPDQFADYLFLREIYGMQLNAVDLATLSACDTEAGRQTSGEGVQSFGRAFLAAGARSTVTTLWRVADEPAAEFMKQFYYALFQGRTKAEALREAKLKFWRSGAALAEPRHWAAFVLNGDGGSPVPPFVSWFQVLLAGAGGLAVLGICAWSVGARLSARRGTA